MTKIVPPHTCAAHLEKLGIRNIPSMCPETINFTRFMRYIEVESYPEEIVEDIYREIVKNPEDGKKHLYKLVLDILIFSGIARDLDTLVGLYRSMDCLDKDIESEVLSKFGTFRYYSQIFNKKRRRKLNKHIVALAFQDLSPGKKRK